MNKYRILHVSDTHFGCHDPKGEMERITGALTSAVRKRVSDVGVGPNLCVFSGDLAYSGIESEYAAAEQWLVGLLSAAGSTCELFVIPGNHDVERRKVTAKIRRDLRAAGNSEDQFGAFRDEVLKAKGLATFRSWHDKAKKNAGLRLISDWSNSPLGCSWTSSDHAIVVVGLNSAVLSFGNDDLGKLVIDSRTLNGFLSRCDPKAQLVIAVSHHPVGVNPPDKGFRPGDAHGWFATWNDADTKRLLLQRVGPHLYLHGHLHHAEGYGISVMSGESLSFFGAGAAYQGSRYPMRFGFYEVDLEGGSVHPIIYTYNPKLGEWETDPQNSHEVLAALPRPNPVTTKTVRAVTMLDESGRHAVREMFSRYVELQEHILEKVIPALGVEIDHLGPELRKKLLVRESSGEKARMELASGIASPPTDSPVEISHAAELLRDGKPEQAADLLLNARVRNPKICEGHPQYFELLISAAAGSNDSRHWQEAIDLLPTYGRATHYHWLAYKKWTVEDYESAVELEEGAMRLAREDKSNDPLLAEKIKNNLAYFTADLKRPEAFERSAFERSLGLINEAIDSVKGAKSEKSRYAQFLDTRGYVRIALDPDETWKKGILDCENARRNGADERLYFKHVQAAAERLNKEERNINSPRRD